MNTSPDISWQKELKAKLVDFPLPAADKADEIYRRLLPLTGSPE